MSHLHRGRPCTLVRPHSHYPDWLETFPAVEQCDCGHHPRILRVHQLAIAWEAGHR